MREITSAKEEYSSDRETSKQTKPHISSYWPLEEKKCSFLCGSHESCEVVYLFCVHERNDKVCSVVMETNPFLLPFILNFLIQKLKERVV